MCQLSGKKRPKEYWRWVGEDLREPVDYIHLIPWKIVSVEGRSLGMRRLELTGKILA